MADYYMCFKQLNYSENDDNLDVVIKKIPIKLNAITTAIAQLKYKHCFKNYVLELMYENISCFIDLNSDWIYIQEIEQETSKKGNLEFLTHYIPHYLELYYVKHKQELQEIVKNYKQTELLNK